MKEILKNRKGITLIALIVTIIVLLILAGISIGAITGDNGIINQAQKAKSDTEYSQWEEQIDVAIIDAESNHRDPTMDDVIDELINKKVINEESQVDKETGAITTNEPSYIIEDKLNEYIVKIPTLGEITGNETTNTESKDSLGNKVVVPAGFKVVNPEDNVEDGIIIEDVSYGTTEGSQFVWVPVGNIHTTEGDRTITLGRYWFNEDGSVNTELSKTEPKEILMNATGTVSWGEGLKDDTTTNTHAIDIEEFISRTKSTGGYYIGRYEARDGTTTVARTRGNAVDSNQLVCTADNYVYNYIDQVRAANLCRNMYSENNNFTSDLINSFAWDTAIVFIQECSGDTDYSIKTSVNSGGIGSIANKGTNNYSKKDVVCNIWDMASNCMEYSTESWLPSPELATMRGGCYTVFTDGRPNGEASSRTGTSASKSYLYEQHSFRPILYL